VYQPPHFQETRLEVLHELIRAHPLGLLVCNGEDGPVANPLPFLLDADAAPKGVLRAHLSRANPQWQAIRAQAEIPVLVVFQGVDTYVTPSWYETKRQTGKVVPTWNYAMVQARGRAVIREDPAWLGQQIAALTNAHEAPRAEPWHVSDAPDAFIAGQMKGIVGIEIGIAELNGKWKVSQNRPAEDRAGVAEGLAAADDHISKTMAELVAGYGSRDKR
jgi:transcriptional regulator